MNLLGIDFGERKIGLALAIGPLSEPVGIVSNLKEIVEICQKNEVEKIIVGVSEGEMAKKQRKFAQELKALTGLPIELQDETLTTNEAILKMKEAGKRIKKIDEDAFAATLILQSYLDRMSSD
jgi:putative transcription antitermination factor YqgF